MVNYRIYRRLNHVNDDSSVGFYNGDEAQPAKKRCIDHTALDNCTDTLCTTSQPPTTKLSTNTYINTAKSTNYDFSDYTEITSFEQRRRYKDSFNRYFQEYIPLFQQTQVLIRSFLELGGEILNVPVDLQEHRRIKECLVVKYKTINREEELRREQRCGYLHGQIVSHRLWGMLTLVNVCPILPHIKPLRLNTFSPLQFFEVSYSENIFWKF